MKQVFVLILMSLSFISCGPLNNTLAKKEKNIEYYRVFDIQTDADRYTISEAASNGLGKNTNNIKENMPIPKTPELPERPGRFKLVNPFEGTRIGALVGDKAKIVKCEDASWTANAKRTITGQSELNLTACLFPYQKGYHLNLYAMFTKQKGGLLELSRKMAVAMVGSPEEWTEKTFLDIVREIQQKTNSKIEFIEGYPKIQGTPWLDTGETIYSK